MGRRISGAIEVAVGYVAVERPDWVPNLVDDLVAEPRRDRTDERGLIAGDRHDSVLVVAAVEGEVPPGSLMAE